MSQASPTLLGLPRELLLDILSYVLPKGRQIKITSKIVRMLRQRHHQKNNSLKPPRSKPRKNAVLATCRELYMLGLESFWGGIVFVFRDAELLETFLGTVGRAVSGSVTSVVLGNDRNSERFTVAWPSELSVLAHMPRLKSLMAHMGRLHDRDSHQYGGVEDEIGAGYQRRQHQDRLLISIPPRLSTAWKV